MVILIGRRSEVRSHRDSTHIVWKETKKKQEVHILFFPQKTIRNNILCRTIP